MPTPQHLNPIIKLLKNTFNLSTRDAKAVIAALGKGAGGSRLLPTGRGRAARLIDSLEERDVNRYFIKGGYRGSSRQGMTSDAIHELRRHRADDFPHGYGMGKGELDPGDIGVLENALRMLLK